MAQEPDSQLAEELSGLLATEEERIIARWSELLRTTQPNLYRSLDVDAWRLRLTDAIATLRAELAAPTKLRYPVFGARSGSGRLIELGERAVEAHLAEELELHEFQGAYFLLQEAIVEAIAESDLAGRELSAAVYVDRFIKQLALALSMAIAARRTEALERAVEARTEHLETIMRKQDEFVSFVSHEVRTGLTAILGACDYLTDISAEHLSAEQMRFVTIIERSGELINVLVNDILDYAKIEAGKIELRLEPVHLREVAMDAIALLEAKWGPKGLDMDLLISPEEPEVLGDRIRLQQVFLNVLANAIRFSPDFSRIVVRGGWAGAEAWVEIEDEGPGVPPADRARIFQRFEQVESAKERGKGTGLGLPIVKLLTEMHGGSVSVADAAPNGSVFRLTFPILMRSPLRQR